MTDETQDNQTDQIDVNLLPDNTLTVFLKINGKVYSKGADVGELKQDMADEDLDSTLRAVRGLMFTIMRTMVVKGANKSETYKLPLSEFEEKQPTET